MLRNSRWLLCLFLTLPCLAQQRTRFNIADILDFENGEPGRVPNGWAVSTPDTVIDDAVFRSGKHSARIIRTTASPGTFTTITTGIPLDFAGSTIQWRGWIKTENVRDYVALWIRVDGDTPGLAFASMEGQGVNGTRDWRQYSLNVPAVPEGKQLVFGFFVFGPGTAWVDDLELLIDGRPVAQAANRPLTVLDTDTEFNSGSRFNPASLDELQVKNLATLAKVWGFLKYHHPLITTGTRHWDYDLFRVLPTVAAAPDSESANTAILDWINKLGDVPACSPCPTLEPVGLYLSPDLDWISNTVLLGTPLSDKLKEVHQNRRRQTSQFYVSLAPNGNPAFLNERTYGAIRFPDSGYQLLALFRYWNMVQYFYPSRDIMSPDPERAASYWHEVLEQSISRVALAANAVAFQQELFRFIGTINDTHANLWSSIAVRPPIGACRLPVDIRFVEDQPLVIRHSSTTDGPSSALQPGDILTHLDGISIPELVSQWQPFYSASNEPTRLRDIANYMTRGACGPTLVTVLRGDQTLQLEPARVPQARIDASGAGRHDLPGPAFQQLSPEVAYLKLSSVKIAEAESYIRSAAGTKGLIIDIRNYPSEFVVFALGSLLHAERTAFVRFTIADISNPGATRWRPPIEIIPRQPRYEGKIVILVDEQTQSQAEYTTMAFRSVPGAIVIGSTTAGADGDVSTIPLPGGFSSLLSGLGVYYPDGSQTQRIGLIPDMWLTPTIAGIRAGRDELIDAAVRHITQ